MKFSVLAGFLEKIESATKRSEMVRVLSEIFREAEAEEIDKYVYFCQGALGPPFKRTVIGLGEKMIIQSISRATGLTVQDVTKQYIKLGDLGLVAEENMGEGKEDADFLYVYGALQSIAEISGKGSVEGKINSLTKLMEKTKPKGAKYIVRFVEGKLRLGAGEATIIEALTVSVKRGRELKNTLERAFNICSDLGLVAKKLFLEGVKGVKEIKVKPGNPIRPALAERLTSPREIIDKIGRCAVESKYDGFRCQVHKKELEVKIFSRRLEEITDALPEIVKGTKKQIKAEEAIFEGEALAFNEETGEFYPFQVTIQRKRKYGVKEMAEEFPLKLFCFDLLYLEGTSYLDKPYIERTKTLMEIIKPGETLKIAERMITENPEELEKYFEDRVEKGLEGIIAKRIDAPYQAGSRNFNWIKLKRSYRGKLTDTIDIVVVGYFKGRGKRVKLGIGAILGAVYDEEKDLFRTVAKVGSGLSEENWMKLKGVLDKEATPNKPARVDSLIEPDVWVKPVYVLTVKADEITRSPNHTCGMKNSEPGYALRFPRLIGWIRGDKGPEDVNTVKEIIEMYKMQ